MVANKNFSQKNETTMGGTPENFDNEISQSSLNQDTATFESQSAQFDDFGASGIHNQHRGPVGEIIYICGKPFRVVEDAVHGIGRIPKDVADHLKFHKKTDTY